MNPCLRFTEVKEKERRVFLNGWLLQVVAHDLSVMGGLTGEGKGFRVQLMSVTQIEGVGEVRVLITN